jgi:hypothetical protein
MSSLMLLLRASTHCSADCLTESTSTSALHGCSVQGMHLAACMNTLLTLLVVVLISLILVNSIQNQYYYHNIFEFYSKIVLLSLLLVNFVYKYL